MPSFSRHTIHPPAITLLRQVHERGECARVAVPHHCCKHSRARLLNHRQIVIIHDGVAIFQTLGKRPDVDFRIFLSMRRNTRKTRTQTRSKRNGDRQRQNLKKFNAVARRDIGRSLCTLAILLAINGGRSRRSRLFQCGLLPSVSSCCTALYTDASSEHR